MPGIAIGVRPKWTPRAFAQIDWTHPLAQRLGFYVWAAGGRWHGTDVPTMGSNARPGSNGFGNAITVGTENSSESASFTKNDGRFMPLSTSSGWTYGTVGIVPTPGGTRYVWSYDDPGPPASGGGGVYATASVVSAFMRRADTTSADISTFSTGRDVHDVFGVSFDPSASLIIGYRGGRRVSSASMADVRIIQDVRPLRIHANSANNGGSSLARLSVVAIWQRTLSPAEHAMFGADPYCLLRQ